MKISEPVAKSICCQNNNNVCFILTQCVHCSYFSIHFLSERCHDEKWSGSLRMSNVMQVSLICIQQDEINHCWQIDLSYLGLKVSFCYIGICNAINTYRMLFLGLKKKILPIWCHEKSQKSRPSGERYWCFLEWVLPRALPNHTSYPRSASKYGIALPLPRTTQSADEHKRPCWMKTTVFPGAGGLLGEPGILKTFRM